MAAHLAPALVLLAGSAVVLQPSLAAAQSTEAECAAANGTWTPGGVNEFGVQQSGSCQQAGASVTASAAQRQQNAPPVGTDCSINPFYFSFGNCMAALVSFLGSLFLSIGAAVLQLAGWIFDWMVKYIVVSFGQTIRDMRILDAITAGWTVFRDFANILIIGFFVFIAISIILGLSEFGQKRLIANVLVVAVLMNFSLLFTKLIIDGSNFVAYQVYTQIASSNGQTTGQFNISERILTPMGISEVWNTYGLVRDVSVKQNSGAAAFAFGLIGGMLLLAIAAVLLYGCFLIAARGIMFIFLMLTAPIAFATYLIPTLSRGEYGWNSWWRMLINNAAFGPLLMILLAISLSILNAAGGRASVPLGDIIASPGAGGADAWMTILVYIIGIGLIFTSLKLASSFAGAAGAGAGGAFGALRFASWSPFAGSAALIGAGLRRQLGGRAAFRSLELESEIAEQRKRANKRGLSPEDKYKENRELMRLLKQKGAADKTATREFNLENTALGKALIKAGMPKVAGDTKGGFAEPRKKAADEAAKATEAAIVSSKQAQEIAKETMDRSQEAEKKRLEDQRESNQKVVEAAESVASSVKQAHHTEREDAFKAAAEATKAMQLAAGDHKDGKIDASRREEIMREQKQRIDEANERIRAANARMKQVDDEHMNAPHVKLAQQQMREAERGLSQLRREHIEGVRDLQKKVLEESIEDAATIAQGIHHLDAYGRAQTGKKFRERLKDKKTREQLKALRSLDEETSSKPAESEQKDS